MLILCLFIKQVIRAIVHINFDIRSY